MPKLKTIGEIIARYLFIVIMCLIILLPILILLFASFKSLPEFINTSEMSLPREWSLTNYVSVARRANLLVAFKNILIIIVVSVVLNVSLGSAFAYALERFLFRGRKAIIALVMGANIIPTVTTQVAIFTIIKSLGLFNSLGAAILLYAGTDVV